MEKDGYWTDFKCPQCNGFRFGTSGNFDNETAIGKCHDCGYKWNRKDDSEIMFHKFEHYEDCDIFNSLPQNRIANLESTLKRAVELLKEEQLKIKQGYYSLVRESSEIDDFLKEVGE